MQVRLSVLTPPPLAPYPRPPPTPFLKILKSLTYLDAFRKWKWNFRIVPCKFLSCIVLPARYFCQLVIHTCVSRATKCFVFSENLACFVFLKHPFWESPFLPYCLRYDESHSCRRLIFITMKKIASVYWY